MPTPTTLLEDFNLFYYLQYQNNNTNMCNPYKSTKTLTLQGISIIISVTSSFLQYTHLYLFENSHETNQYVRAPTHRHFSNCIYKYMPIYYIKDVLKCVLDVNVKENSHMSK